MTANLNPKLQPPMESINTSSYRIISAASINANVIKNGAGNIYMMVLHNGAASARFIKLYNKATTPVPASDTPIATILIPAGQTLIIQPAIGWSFSNGIAYTITQLVTDTDATAVVLNDVVANILYA